MAGVQLKLDRRFYKQAKGVYERYQFDVGVLQDKNHKYPLSKGAAIKRLEKKGAGVSDLTKYLFTTLAGGPARRLGKKSPQSVAQVSEDLRKRTGINFYTKPFRSKGNRDILKFVRRFMEVCSGRGQVRQLENLLQAIIRNPIVRGDYGGNSDATAKSKGFNRFMIDTGQLFKAIVAKVKVRNVS